MKLSLASLLALLLPLTGCQLVVDFDRSKIPDGAMPDGAMDLDGGDDVDAGDADAGDADAGDMDAGDVDAGDVDGGDMDGGDLDGGDVDGGAMDGGEPDGGDPDGGMVCGNGVVEGTETCDDGNTDACGTCSADCGTVQTPAAATGSLVTPAVAMLADAETITLDDGVNAATVLELDDDASVTSGNVAVDISGITTADEARDALIAAINGVTTALQITASSGGVGQVDLVNDEVGSFGNQPIMETVSDAGFVATGMTGGVAADCAAGTGCDVDDDCVSTCTSMMCD